MTDIVNQTPEPADVDSLSYEQARDELRAIVTEMEAGNGSLDEVLGLFKRGSALAQRCSDLLDRAESEVVTIEQGSVPAPDPDGLA